MWPLYPDLSIWLDEMTAKYSYISPTSPLYLPYISIWLDEMTAK